MITVKSDTFGTIGNEPITRFTLANDAGMQVAIINYGATIQALITPDRDGAPADIVLGFDDIAGYTSARNPYFGAICGRVANRITKGRFTLDGTEYQLATNDGPNSLHGGQVGFDKRIWHAEATEGGVSMTLHSPDGEEGYPGSMDITVTYTLTEACELHIDYTATTDATTIVNLTNHSYFNLAGHGAGAVYDQQLTMRTPSYTPVDDTLMPTGEVAPVAGTPLDFLALHAIGDQIEAAGGYDHNFIFTDGPAPAVRVVDPASGRCMEMETTEPAVQFYSGNFLNGVTGKAGASYRLHSGFCLEAQHYPDSINNPDFPSTVLQPGDTYTQRTTYRFGIA
jgi:aldose 1-epimerase